MLFRVDWICRLRRLNLNATIRVRRYISCHAARTTYETEQNSISILRQRFVPEYRDLVNRPRARTATTLHP